jgi:hypothetical protein
MKIRVVSDDYIKFFKLYIKNELVYPVDNPCFNMSFCKFYNNKYLFCVRNVILYKQLIKKEKLYPGISKYFLMMSQQHTENNLSNTYIWDWKNYYQTIIFFVGTINENTLKINPDKTIKPHVLISPSFSYKLPKYLNNKLLSRYRLINLEDFRLFFSNNIAYVYDGAINKMYEMMLIKNKLILKNTYSGICDINNEVPYMMMTNNYVKIFEKNWSLYKVNRKMKKDIEFKFIHDFEENGIYGINFFPEKNKCKKELLVSYKPNTIPINSSIVRFSLSSPCIKLSSNLYLGLGHIKVKFYKITEENHKTDKDEPFIKMALEIHKKMRQIYKTKYRPHKMFVYMNFLFEYNSIKKTFHISDFLLPIPKYDYYFSLSFLTSISIVNNKIIMTGGIGDYSNIMINMDLNELKIIKHDISNLNINDLSFIIVK